MYDEISLSSLEKYDNLDKYKNDKRLGWNIYSSIYLGEEN